MGSRQRKRETAHADSELATLVGVRTAPFDKAPNPVRSSVEEPTPDLQLPGDDPPPSGQVPGRTSNSYTPYNRMGSATAAAAKAADDGARRSAGVTKTDDARKTSVAGRAASPLPALPTEAAASAVTSEPEELYVNADAHIYEGMRHEAPIYENRSVGMYESLGASKDKGK